MQLLDVCAKREYEKEGKKESKFYRIGYIKISDAGKMYLRLYIMPQSEFFIMNRNEDIPPENLPVIS